MSITPIPAFEDNYIWAIEDLSSNEFDCVDPGDAQPVLHYAKTKKSTLRSILITHHHQDHMGGIHELLSHFPNIPVFGPKSSSMPHITQHMNKDSTLPLGQHVFQILETPGHTATHISYYEPQKGWLFCGDTLFSAGCGRVFDGTIEQLHATLVGFNQLPPNTLIFCAHEYTLANLRFAEQVEPNNSSIKDYFNHILKHKSRCTLPSRLSMEQKINPFLRTSVEEVIHYAINHGAQNKSSFEVFKVLRTMKNSFK